MKNKYEDESQNKYVSYQDFIKSAEARQQMVANMNLMDDVMFAVAMQDTKACEYVLREITGIKTLHVISSKAQFSIVNLTTHSVILDVIAEDDTGQLFNIEIQKSNNDHHPKRIRYYQANVDTTFLAKGVKYEICRKHGLYLFLTSIHLIMEITIMRLKEKSKEETALSTTVFTRYI